MGTKEKLIERFLMMPRDFTFEEVVRLFSVFGFKRSDKGRTSGSRVEFERGLDKFCMHKPHPGNIIKSYVMKDILKYINDNNLIIEYYNN